MVLSILFIRVVKVLAIQSFVISTQVQQILEYLSCQIKSNHERVTLHWNTLCPCEPFFFLWPFEMKIIPLTSILWQQFYWTYSLSLKLDLFICYHSFNKVIFNEWFTRISHHFSKVEIVTRMPYKVINSRSNKVFNLPLTFVFFSLNCNTY